VDVVFGRSTTGESVAEVDLDETSLSIAEVVEQARSHGAGLVWAHGGSPGDGFEPRSGYAHLHAADPRPGTVLPTVAAEEYGTLLAEAYLGQWGHKWVEPDQPLPTDGSVVLALREQGIPVGVCRLWPDQRLVDMPGVVPRLRGAERTVRLLGAACAVLGPGSVDVDSWGESPEVLRACGELGFAITEQQRGWELRL
jgi:hypothetical protein